MSLLAPTAFTFFADLLAQYEGVSSGATWADAFSDPLPIAAILFMLTFDTALYSASILIGFLSCPERPLYSANDPYAAQCCLDAATCSTAACTAAALYTAAMYSLDAELHFHCA